MKTPVIDRLIILSALMADAEFGHAGLIAVIRLSGHKAVFRATMATAGKRVVVESVGGIKNIANTVRTGYYVGQYKN